MNTLRSIAMIVLTGLLALLVWTCLNFGPFSHPTVFRSFSTNAVIKVEDHEGRPLPVSPLPERYNHVWVQ